MICKIKYGAGFLLLSPSQVLPSSSTLSAATAVRTREGDHCFVLKLENYFGSCAQQEIFIQVNEDAILESSIQYF